MIAIHGGGWRSRDKGEFGLRTANAFTPEGYVVVAPNYVLSAPGKPTWPENFEDVQAAVRWVRGHAGTLGVNPVEIVAEGESAGANLAALLGVYSTRASGGEVSSSVDAVVAVSTPANLTTLYHQKPMRARRPRNSWVVLPARSTRTTSRPRRSIMFHRVIRRLSSCTAGKTRLSP